MAQKAIIIGAGISGIAAAIRMAVKGYTVDVYESNGYPGGKLTAFEQGGFRFDAGPSLFTMPHLVEELFLLADESIADHFLYERMDEACRYFWEDHTRLTAWSEHSKFASEAEQQLGADPKKVIEGLKHSQKLYDLTGEIFHSKILA